MNMYSDMMMLPTFGELEQELKRLIILTLELESIGPEDIVSHDPLFEEGLGLDSIDALDLSLAVQRVYGVQVSVDSFTDQGNLLSVESLARVIADHQTC